VKLIVNKARWAFKLNLPGGTPSMFMARFFIRDDLKKEGSEYNLDSSYISHARGLD